MPSKSPTITDDVAKQAIIIGKHIRDHRKSLRVSATSAAQAAGMSRITWYRLEKGEPSVTMGAYLSAMDVLGLEFKAVSPSLSDTALYPDDAHNNEGWVPVIVDLAEYPQLKQLAWQVHGVDKLSPREALDIYERNWRHLDLEAMEPQERCLVDALRLVFTDGAHDV